MRNLLATLCRSMSELRKKSAGTRYVLLLLLSAYGTCRIFQRRKLGNVPASKSDEKAGILEFLRSRGEDSSSVWYIEVIIRDNFRSPGGTASFKVDISVLLCWRRSPGLPTRV